MTTRQPRSGERNGVNTILSQMRNSKTWSVRKLSNMPIVNHYYGTPVLLRSRI